MKDIFIRICVGVGLTLISWLAERVIAFINGKIKADKLKRFLSGAVDIVTDSVKATYQTYVEALKKDGAFTEEAQKQALENAKSKIRLGMSVSMKQYIEENVGDFEIWLDTAIHSILYDLKK